MPGRRYERLMVGGGCTSDQTLGLRARACAWWKEEYMFRTKGGALIVRQWRHLDLIIDHAVKFENRSHLSVFIFCVICAHGYC